MNLVINSFFLKNSRTFIHKLINYKFFLINVVGSYNLLFLNFILGYDFVLNFYFLDIFKLIKLYYNLRLFLFETISQNNKCLILLPNCFYSILKNKNLKQNISYFQYFLDIFSFFSKFSFVYIFSKISSGFYTNKMISLLYDSIINLDKLNVLKYSLFSGNLSQFYNNVFAISTVSVNLSFPDFVILFDSDFKQNLLKEFYKMYIPFFCLCDIYCDSLVLNFFNYLMLSSKDNYSNYLFNFLLLSFFFFEGYLNLVSKNVFFYISNISNFIGRFSIKSNICSSTRLLRNLLFSFFLSKFLDLTKFKGMRYFFGYYLIFEIFLFKFNCLNLF